MKHNTMKRVLAATLSVLTVAAPMTANVGGVLQEVAIVANAKSVTSERVAFSWAPVVYNANNGKTFLQSFSINGVTQTGLTGNDNTKIQSGSVVLLESLIPLDFTFNQGDAQFGSAVNNDIRFTSLGKSLPIAGSEYEGYVYNAEEKLFMQDDKPNMTPDELMEALLGKAGYDVDTDATFTKASAWNDEFTELNVNFYAKETVTNGKYSYSFVMPADNEDTTADQLSINPFVQDITVKYYSSEANRTHKVGNNPAAIEWGAAGDTEERPAFGEDGYFTGLKITSTDTAKTRFTATATADDPAIKAQYIGDTVVVTAANPFAVHVSDNNDRNNWINPDITFDSKNNTFVARFTMPKSVNDAPVQIDIVKIDEEYTYAVESDKLLATSKTGSIKNAEAASIVARSYTAQDYAEFDATKFAKSGDKGAKITGDIANGSYIVIGTTFSEKLANFKSIVIKKGSKVLTTAADGDELSMNGDYYVIAKKAGTYTVTYTLTGKDNKDYEVTSTFTIAAKSALTVKNVELAFTVKKDNRDYNDLAYLMAEGQNLVNWTVKSGQTASYMLAKGIAAQVKKANYQFTVTPTVYTDSNHQHPLDPASYYVEGTPSGSTLDKTYTFTIYITDPEYGGSTSKPKQIQMTWSIQDYDSVPQWNADALWNMNVRVPGRDTVSNAQASIESINRLSDIIFRKAQANDAAYEAKKADKVSYQWIAGSGAVRTGEYQDELDEYQDGLPTEMGDYTVYIIYNDVVRATVNVTISQYVLNIDADQSDLTYTYGQKFELKKPTVQKNSKGEVVDAEVSDLTCSIYRWETDRNGDYVRGDEIYRNVPVDQVGQLNAGTYAIYFDGTTSNENYAVNDTTEQKLIVKKKEITDPSIVILIDPFAYTNTQHNVVTEGQFTVRDTDFEPGDARYDISKKFKITEGGKQSKAGEYDCTFKLVSTQANYKGEAVNSKWHIVAKEAKAANVDAGLTWSEKSTIYNSGRIHVEINRNADDKINKDNSVADIVAFGVVIDKDAKIAPPAVYGVDYGNDVNDLTEDQYEAGMGTAAEREKFIAKKFLQVGSGFTTGEYTKTTTPKTCASQTYMANIKVKNVETGIWARPYVQYKNGTVSYGDVKYMDLTHEAIEKLGLKMAEVPEDGKAVRKADLTKDQTKTLKKTMTYVKSGYNVVENKFYAYTSYTDLESAGFTDISEVADFGVVLDRTGAIAANADGADVDKALRIGASKDLVVGHYKKDNPVLKENEYAASIKLGNTATGCWARAYVDLGGGLVIYDDPIYMPSASEYYGKGETAGNLRVNWENDSKARLVIQQDTTAQARIRTFAAKAGVNANKVEIVKTGVVVDKKNLLNKSMTTDGFGNQVLDPAAPFNTQMLLDAGFIAGKKSTDFDQLYTGKVSPKDKNDISVRSYTIFKINANGKSTEVTVYGDVSTFEYTDRVGRIVNERRYDNTGEIAPVEIGEAFA